MEQWLDEGDFLTKVQVFQLWQRDMNAFILVHETITGPKKGTFFAEPTNLIGDTKEEFFGRGSTVEEALEDCLRRIKGKAINEILGLPRK